MDMSSIYVYMYRGLPQAVLPGFVVGQQFPDLHAPALTTLLGFLFEAQDLWQALPTVQHLPLEMPAQDKEGRVREEKRNAGGTSSLTTHDAKWLDAFWYPRPGGNRWHS